jgi:hypothetical protein
MCYARYEDFGRRAKKDASWKPEARPERMPAERPDTRAQEEESRLWTFLARRRESTVAEEPRTERIRETV